MQSTLEIPQLGVEKFETHCLHAFWVVAAQLCGWDVAFFLGDCSRQNQFF